MRTKNRFTVFEHHTLTVGTGGFTEAHRKRLEMYGGSGTPYFRLVHRGAKFGAYVGVLQVGPLTIEILPKTDGGSAGKNAVQPWRAFLLRMLQAARLLPHTTEDAALRLQPHSVLEIYFHLFLEQVRYLLQTGLAKGYHAQEGNGYALRGRLLFPAQLRHNSIHAERFFTRHTVYDADHIHNAILAQTLELICRQAPSPELQTAARALQSTFPKCRYLPITEDTFNRLHYTRKTESYQPATRIARLLLLHYHPDVRGGENTALALLFNMNQLWEACVLEQLRRELEQDYPRRYVLRIQVSTPFWKPLAGRPQRLYPDIVIARTEAPQKALLVLDTKWKQPLNDRPAETDLRQMLAYNIFSRCPASALVYPAVGQSKTVQGRFAAPDETQCALLYLSLELAAGGAVLDLLPVKKLLQKAAAAFV